MDIRRFLVGGKTITSQNQSQESPDKKKPVSEISIINKKSIKTSSKFFSSPTNTPESSDTEKIPSSPEISSTQKISSLEEEKKLKKSEPEKIPLEKIAKEKMRQMTSDEDKKNKKFVSGKPVGKKIEKEEKKKTEKNKEKNNGSEIIVGPLSGKTFVITGLMKEFPRDSLTDLIKEFGGKVTGQVSKRTSYLVHGYKLEDGRDFTLGNKYKKAQELGTKILSEEEIKKIIDDCTSKKLAQEALEESKSEPSHFPSRIPKTSPKIHSSLSNHSPKVSVDSDSNLWTEKYKPTTLDDLIGNTSLIEKLANWLEDWDSVILEKNSKPLSPGRNGKFDSTSNVNAPAVLLSGPPGIGKTTAARLVALSFGYQSIEMNASNSRNKNLVLSILSEGSKSNSLSDKGDIVKKLIIMDEVDGMSAGDRGGIAALIQVIKTTKNPIICICNDRQSQKLKSLINYCYDLRFSKPNKLQITRKMCEIMKNEGISIEPNAIEQIVETSGNDIRQVLTTLEMWARTNSNMTYMRAKQSLRTMNKDPVTMISNFDAAGKLFNHREMQRLSHKEKIDLAFIDYELIPLLVYENYLSACDQIKLKDMAEAADAISIGDIMNNSIRNNGNWAILPQYLEMACIYPTTFCPYLVPFAKFPEWFGKFSTQRKNERLLKELQHALGGIACHGFESTMDEYVPILNSLIFQQLSNDQIEETADLLYEFNLNPEMLKEHLTCLNDNNGFKNVSANSKRKLTLIFNEKYKNSILKVKGKKNGKETSEEKFDPEYQEAQIEEEEGEDEEIEEKIVPEVKKGAKKKRNK